MLKSTLVLVVVGLAGGLLGWKLKLPGGIIIGAMLLVIVYKVVAHHTGSLPFAYKFLVQALIGTLVGAMFELDMLASLREAAVPIALSTVILVSTGFLVALFVAYFSRLDITTAYLATSPGGMSATIGLAFAMQAQPPLVLAFHFVRIVFINLTAPLVFQLLRHFGR